MWGNDLPHPEGTFPYTRYWIRERFHDVPEDEARRMLGLTAAEVYGVDVDALRPMVDKIGPTVDEVHGRRRPSVPFPRPRSRVDPSDVHRHVRGTAHGRRMHHLDAVLVDGPLGMTVEHLVDDDCALETCQSGAEAEVRAVTERHVAVDLALDVEAVRIGVLTFVTAR